MRLLGLIGLTSLCAGAQGVLYPRARQAVVLAAWLLAGCASAPPTPAAPAEVESQLCPLGVQSEDLPALPGTAPRPFNLALPGPIDPGNAPIPRTPGERILFAQLYETLLRLDCQGRVQGLLAETWSVAGDDLEWTFILRQGLRDWNGNAVSATTVAESWMAAAGRASSDPIVSRVDAALPPTRITALAALDSRRLRVSVSQPVDAAWFARSELAVRTSTSPSGWPVGTGLFRPSNLETAGPPIAGGDSSLSLVGPVDLEVRTFSGDPRIPLERGSDLLVTHAPDIIEYAQASSAFITTPLAWDRAYLLAVPAASGRDMILRDPENERRSLQDALPVASREWRDAHELGECVHRVSRIPRDPPVPRTATRTRRIVYQTSDPAARALAERLTAMALDQERLRLLAREPGREEAAWLTELVPDLAGAGVRPSAAALSGDAFMAALERGLDAVYVVAIDRSELTADCSELAHVAALAPWLRVTTEAEPPVRPAVIPLFDTPSTLVLRRGVEGAAVDGSRRLLLSGLRRVATETPR